MWQMDTSKIWCVEYWQYDGKEENEQKDVPQWPRELGTRSAARQGCLWERAPRLPAGPADIAGAGEGWRWRARGGKNGSTCSLSQGNAGGSQQNHTTFCIRPAQGNRSWKFSGLKIEYAVDIIHFATIVLLGKDQSENYLQGSETVDWLCSKAFWLNRGILGLPLSYNCPLPHPIWKEWGKDLWFDLDPNCWTPLERSVVFQGSDEA